MILFEMELRPRREVISWGCHGCSCSCKETVHFDSIPITTHYLVREETTTKSHLSTPTLQFLQFLIEIYLLILIRTLAKPILV
jgi:hypothetical protein